MATTGFPGKGSDTHATGSKFVDKPGIDDTGLGGMLDSVRQGACIGMLCNACLQRLQLRTVQPRGFREAPPKETFPFEDLSLPTLQESLRR